MILLVFSSLYLRDFSGEVARVFVIGITLASRAALLAYFLLFSDTPSTFSLRIPALTSTDVAEVDTASRSFHTANPGAPNRSTHIQYQQDES
jgi:hypothetical protein